MERNKNEESELEGCGGGNEGMKRREDKGRETQRGRGLEKEEWQQLGVWEKQYRSICC